MFRRGAQLIAQDLDPVPSHQADDELLLKLPANRCEGCSMYSTAIAARADWARVFRDNKLTTALIDGAGHYAHILATKGAPAGLLAEHILDGRRSHSESDHSQLDHLFADEVDHFPSDQNVDEQRFGQ